MKTSTTLPLLISLIFLLGSTATYALQPPFEDSIENDSLVKTENAWLDEFYVSRDKTISAARTVFIADTSVEFSEPWLREFQRSTNKRYIDDTSQRYAGELKEQITRVFSESGQFEVVDSRESADLIVKANITDLYINGPDLRNFKKYYVYSAGEATLNLTIKSPSGHLLAKIKDHDETSIWNSEKPERTNRALNHRDFQRLMARWSKQVVEALGQK